MRGRGIGTRGAVALLAVLGLTASAAGCTADDTDHTEHTTRTAAASPTAPVSVSSQDLVASVAQFRYAEGTPDLRAGVTNNGEVPIRVSSATIVWDGLAFPMVPVPDPDALPGQTAAFTIAYGRARCDQETLGTPALVAVVDGRTTRLPLKVEDPGLLVRLHAKACAQQHLDGNASVRLVLQKRTVFVDGEEYLPGQVVVDHRSGGHQAVTLVDLGGSVLIDLVPRRPGSLPTRVGTATTGGAVDVLLGSAHRCDAHARGQSSQTFLLSGYLRVGRSPVQRQVFIPSIPEQERLLALIDRDCRG